MFVQYGLFDGYFSVCYGKLDDYSCTMPFFALCLIYISSGTNTSPSEIPGTIAP